MENKTELKQQLDPDVRTFLDMDTMDTHTFTSENRKQSKGFIQPRVDNIPFSILSALYTTN